MKMKPVPEAAQAWIPFSGRSPLLYAISGRQSRLAARRIRKEGAAKKEPHKRFAEKAKKKPPSPIWKRGLQTAGKGLFPPLREGGRRPCRSKENHSLKTEIACAQDGRLLPSRFRRKRNAQERPAWRRRFPRRSAQTNPVERPPAPAGGRRAGASVRRARRGRTDTGFRCCNPEGLSPSRPARPAQSGIPA